jgi:thiol-disulfide isomerase/thioredoxin
MKMRSVAGALFGLLLLLPAHPAGAARGQLKVYQGELVSPRIELNDINGQPHSLTDYRGNIVLVQFWATYCTPCRKEMPTMNRLIEKMQDKAFRIVTVNMAESKQQVLRFLDEVPVNFPVLMDNDGSTLGQWKVFAAPANFILDKNGEVIFTLYGAIEWDSPEMVEQLTALADR